MVICESLQSMLLKNILQVYIEYLNATFGTYMPAYKLCYELELVHLSMLTLTPFKLHI